MTKTKLTEEEKDKTYSALKLIECLYSQGKVPKHVFRNILNDYKHQINMNDFQCCNYT